MVIIYLTCANAAEAKSIGQGKNIAYTRLKTKKGETQFLLELYDERQPFFTAVRRIKQYIHV